MSGTLSIGVFEINTDSIVLNQIEDVFIISETHNDLIRFNENATDPTYTDGFVNKSGIQISEVDDINVSSTPPHNSFCLLYTSPSPRDRQKSRMPSSA